VDRSKENKTANVTTREDTNNKTDYQINEKLKNVTVQKYFKGTNNSCGFKYRKKQLNLNLKNIFDSKLMPYKNN
jgi:hypothetical protein